MALMEIKLRSKIMILRTSVNVILPEQPDPEKPIKVLWLLHGLSDDHSVWCRNTSIERYVQGKNICVIMPAVDRSFYSDMVYGNKYFTYISQELPKMMQAMLPISTKREDNYVAGLSMGGYGAFKLAMNQPERFAAAASLSGALDMMTLYEGENHNDKDVERLTELIFGGVDRFKNSMNDLRYMAGQVKDIPNLPELFICCGKDDFLYEMNVGYKDYLKSLNIPVTYEEEAGYEHTWDYWDLKIKRTLEWMGL